MVTVNKDMLKGLKIALFDLDGTIIDTEPYHYRCWNDILLALGHSMNYDYYLSTFAGVAIDRNCEYMIERYQLNVSVSYLKSKKEELMIDFLEKYPLSTMTFVREMIGFLLSNKVRLGLVTSSSQQEVEIILKRLKLDTTFECVVTRDDVLRKKPDPEPYIRAKSLFNSPVEDFLVFEDSFSGVKSAKDAQMKCLAIQKNISADSPIRLIADGVFSDFEELKQKL